mgnify:CR=1 FL=1
MTREVNTYFALLIITIAGALGTSLIVRTVHDNTFIVTFGGAANYTASQSQY